MIYNNHISLESSVRINGDYYRFKKFENLDANLQYCLEFWYVDMLNHWWYQTNLQREDLLIHLRRKVKHGLINIEKFREMVKLYGDQNCDIYADLGEIGTLL